MIESRALLDDRLRIVRWTEQRLLQGIEAELLRCHHARHCYAEIFALLFAERWARKWTGMTLD